MALTRRTLLEYTLGASAAMTATPRMAFAEAARWDMADEYGEQALTGQAAKFFISEVEKRLGGALAVTYQGGGALGYKSADQFDAVQDGAVQSAVTLLTQLGGIDPLFDLSSLPFIANSPEEAYLLWQVARPEYEKVFEANNMVLLWAMPNPPSGIHAKTPITSAEAIEGLRIRTYDANGTRTLRRAGAAPLQIAWSDLVPQLSTGGIDAVLTSADGGVQLSIWDYLTDFTELNYAMALFVAHVNRDAFDRLPADARQALMDMIPVSDKHNWKIMQETIGRSYEIMRENGMQVTLDDDVPPEVFERLSDAGAEVRAAWIERTGERAERILKEFDRRRRG